MARNLMTRNLMTRNLMARNLMARNLMARNLVEMERHEQHSPEVVVVASVVAVASVVVVALAVGRPSPFLRAQRGLANSTGGQSQPARPKEARAEKANKDQAEPTNEKKRNRHHAHPREEIANGRGDGQWPKRTTKSEARRGKPATEKPVADPAENHRKRTARPGPANDREQNQARRTKQPRARKRTKSRPKDHAQERETDRAVHINGMKVR
jgi:hypothetical protein